MGIYLRISDDPDGTSTATTRQRQDCEAWCANNGAIVSDVFEDIDISAWNKRKHRPEFQRMLDAVKGRQIDGVIAWKTDRIYRRPRDYSALDDACDDAGAFILGLNDGVDTRVPGTGNLLATIVMGMARAESDTLSIRQRRKQREIAEVGRPHIGGRRKFGYQIENKTLVIDEEEAALIHEAAQRVLDGERLHTVARDWARRGITTPAGNPWRLTTLRDLFIASKHLAGIRTYHGEDMPQGWPAIIPLETLTRVQATILSHPQLKALTRRGKQSLIGVLLCGRCGYQLVSSTTRGKRCYRCSAINHPTACGSLAVAGELIEDAILRDVLDHIDNPALAARMAEPANNGFDASAIYAALERDQASMVELSAAYHVEKALTRGEYSNARALLSARIEKNQAELMRHLGTPDTVVLPDSRQAVEDWWPTASPDERRRFICIAIESVTVKPRGRGAHSLRPSDYVIAWRL